MSLAKYEKDPDDTVDYSIDWSARLNVAGGTSGTIVNVVHTVPSGITVVTQNATDYISTVRLSGGTSGEEYKIQAVMTSSDGEVVTEVFHVSIVDQ